MDRNRYEEKQADRKERYEERARNARQESTELWERGGKMAEAIPFGQPILVGHHSEKRDRNYRAKIDRTFDKACAATDKAKHYESKAAGVGKAGISSDDPDAVVKLKAKLAKWEALQKQMKAVNAAHKKYLKDPASLEKSDLHKELKNKIRTYEPQYSWEPHPYPPYALQNNNANIRRMKERCKTLAATADDETTTKTVNGVEVVDNVEENRLQLFFDGKPSEQIRATLKSNGFRWSRYNMAWQRQRGNNAAWAAERVLATLDTTRPRVLTDLEQVEALKIRLTALGWEFVNVTEHVSDDMSPSGEYSLTMKSGSGICATWGTDQIDSYIT